METIFLYPPQRENWTYPPNPQYAEVIWSQKLNHPQKNPEILNQNYDTCLENGGEPSRERESQGTVLWRAIPKSRYIFSRSKQPTKSMKCRFIVDLVGN